MSNVQRVLIADDDEDLVETLARRCQALGLRVEKAFDGMSALQRIDSLEPDLLILDVNMPCGDGLGVLQMISRDARLKAIPTIVLTGRKDKETVRRCRNLLVHYVPKGTDVWPRLERLITRLLHRPSSTAAASTAAVKVRRDQPQRHSPIRSLGTSPRLSPSTAPPAPVPVEPRTAMDCIEDRYIDAIFAALGWSDENRSLPTKGPPAAPDDRPWVLCVDDDPQFVDGLRRRLERHGIGVDTASAGMEGYCRAFTSQARAILLDFEMPDGNGAYVLRRLKENPVTSGIPVIVLTGRKDRSLERTMYNLGAVRHLNKPIEWDKLLAELGRFMEVMPEMAAR